MYSLFIYAFDRQLFSALSVLITASQLKVRRGADGKSLLGSGGADKTPNRQINTHSALYTNDAMSNIKWEQCCRRRQKGIWHMVKGGLPEVVCELRPWWEEGTSHAPSQAEMHWGNRTCHPQETGTSSACLRNKGKVACKAVVWAARAEEPVRKEIGFPTEGKGGHWRLLSRMELWYVIYIAERPG